MRRYADRSGESGVVAYEIRDDGILVRFRDGPVYLYNAEKPGPAHVAEMQARAQAGRGLSTYISQHVGDNYAEKWPSP
jgi:hypothetical protein